VPEEEGSEAASVKTAKPVAEKLPHSILVKEVVREPRMHYFKVPRLGSYMAIRLEYDSCLNEAAFDAGVKEMENVQKRRREQEEEKSEWEKAEKKFLEIVPEPYQKTKVQYVVCLNTCGQDREFTEEQRLYALRCI
jgi:hypothetical protein